MPISTELHIVIPGICGPLAEIETLKTNQVVNDWTRLLSRANQSSSSENVYDVIATLFSIQTNNDFPSAALSLMRHEQYDADHFYMHADPVHLRADIDSAILSSSDNLNISNEESVALCETLNSHFSQDGLSFLMLNKDQWFVSCKNKITLKTTSLNEAVGRNINFILPSGNDSIWWKQRLTEAQMLLHSHDINNQRENSGLLSINSLWFYGSGDLIDIDMQGCHINSVCSRHPILRGLAEYVQCDYFEMPESAKQYSEYLRHCQPGSQNVFILHDLEHLTNYTDTRPWLNKLTQVIDDWVYPILKIANKNKIKVTLYPCNGNKYQFSKFDYLKLWRNSRLLKKYRLEKYINSY